MTSGTVDSLSEEVFLAMPQLRSVAVREFSIDGQDVVENKTYL